MEANEISLLFSIFALIVSGTAAAAGVGRWRAANREIKVRNLFLLSEFLHQTECHEARHRIAGPEIGEVDERAARKVCSSFDFAGLFVKHGLVDPAIFFEYWGDMLPLLHRRLSPFLQRKAVGELTGYEYWKHFAWLLDSSERYSRRDSG